MNLSLRQLGSRHKTSRLLCLLRLHPLKVVRLRRTGSNKANLLAMANRQPSPLDTASSSNQCSPRRMDNLHHMEAHHSMDSSNINSPHISRDISNNTHHNHLRDQRDTDIAEPNLISKGILLKVHLRVIRSILLQEPMVDLHHLSLQASMVALHRLDILPRDHMEDISSLVLNNVIINARTK